MATGDIPILTAFQGHTPEMKQLIVDTVIERAAILNILPVYQIQKGFTFEELENVTGALGNPAFRALNSDFTNTSTQFRERKYGVKQLGDAVRVEKVVEEQMPGTLSRQIRSKLKAMGMFITDKFINGDSLNDEAEFDGLKVILGGSGDYVVTDGADLTINTDASTFNAFLDLLDEAYRKIARRASAILCSDVLHDAVTSEARSGIHYLQSH
jgi:hypothetical protein